MAIRQVKYDFSDMEAIFINLLEGNHSRAILNDLRDELNVFFRDSKCVEVLYTENEDKLFFGMSTLPIISGDDVINILNTDKNIRIKSYYIELDSKLFDPMLGLTPRELTAIMLHEVGHVVNSNDPIENIRNAVGVYLLNNDEVLKISDSVHYKEILAYGIKNSFRKFCSIFEKPDEEVVADEFCYAYGYGPELNSAFDKLIKKSPSIHREVNNKLAVLTWTLRLYKDVKHRRIAARRQMKRTMSLTASKLDKKEMQNVINRLDRIDDDALLEAKILDKFFKPDERVYRSAREFEDELYEFQLRVKNLTDEDEAYTIVRQINLRMAVIDDILHNKNSSTMDESTRKRFSATYDKYAKIREEVAKKQLYNSGYSTLYVKYPDIKPNRY